MRASPAAGDRLSRGLEGFIAEVIEDHIRQHLVDPAAPKSDPRVRTAEELVAIVHSYLT